MRGYFFFFASVFFVLFSFIFYLLLVNLSVPRIDNFQSAAFYYWEIFHFVSMKCVMVCMLDLCFFLFLSFTYTCMNDVEFICRYYMFLVYITVSLIIVNALGSHLEIICLESATFFSFLFPSRHLFRLK